MINSADNPSDIDILIEALSHGDDDNVDNIIDQVNQMIQKSLSTRRDVLLMYNGILLYYIASILEERDEIPSVVFELLHQLFEEDESDTDLSIIIAKRNALILLKYEESCILTLLLEKWTETIFSSQMTKQTDSHLSQIVYFFQRLVDLMPISTLQQDFIDEILACSGLTFIKKANQRKMDSALYDSLEKIFKSCQSRISLVELQIEYILLLLSDPDEAPFSDWIFENGLPILSEIRRKIKTKREAVSFKNIARKVINDIPASNQTERTLHLLQFCVDFLVKKQNNLSNMDADLILATLRKLYSVSSLIRASYMRQGDVPGQEVYFVVPFKLQRLLRSMERSIVAIICTSKEYPSRLWNQLSSGLKNQKIHKEDALLESEIDDTEKNILNLSHIAFEVAQRMDLMYDPDHAQQLTPSILNTIHLYQKNVHSDLKSPQNMIYMYLFERYCLLWIRRSFVSHAPNWLLLVDFMRQIVVLDGASNLQVSVSTPPVLSREVRGEMPKSKLLPLESIHCDSPTAKLLQVAFIHINKTIISVGNSPKRVLGPSKSTIDLASTNQPIFDFMKNDADELIRTMQHLSLRVSDGSVRELLSTQAKILVEYVKSVASGLNSVQAQSEPNLSTIARYVNVNSGISAIERTQAVPPISRGNSMT